MNAPLAGSGTRAHARVAVSAVTPSFPWELEAPLGRGGQGSTFRARHVETGQIAAVKRFRVSELADWKRFDLFEREVATLAQLDHPAIPHYLGHGTSEDGTERWLAMELVPGDSLATRLQAGLTLSPEAIADLFHQALDILAYLHSRVPPIIHRDVKPHNLIVRPDGRLALVDFGSVKTSLRLDGGSSSSAPSATSRPSSSTVRPAPRPTSTRWASPWSPWRLASIQA